MTPSVSPAMASLASGKSKKAASSKTEMLRFALPALGIYLANPIMSNIVPRLRSGQCGAQVSKFG